MLLSDSIRKDYTLHGLNESDLHPDPVQQFGRWFEQAVQAGLLEPNAMTLATATPDGAPSARMMLLKGCDARGFVFFTNYESQKGRELQANARAALVFYWAALEREVRITGVVGKVSREESDAYFQSRPEGARVGAWASRQSRVTPSREELEARAQQLTAEFGGRPIPLPPHWGGYRLTPDALEFWQGRPSRLHDRLRYTRRPEGGWKIERLEP
ncbi:MAG: pyridoxamine 5'-phosphate oxidase [Chloroflexi bacterium]|nr:pyridoxamine 5'-phosphate oxidase [Chloroflexota bacterium]